jgi:FkbM family methyltransferase
MNELAKYQLQRWFLRHGVRLESARHAKFSYEACNFGAINQRGTPVIFDVGANIGQTSAWFSRSFPGARIYAFEPFEILYQSLQMRFADSASVLCVNQALGATNRNLHVPRIKDPLFQGGQVLPAGPAATETEQISMCTVDSFCQENEIDHLFILKTDTEGYDLEVLRGAEEMLNQGKVTNVLSEASIDRNDSQHTNLFDMTEHLRRFCFELHGLYDLHHNSNDGRLEYFNVLFRLKAS